MAWWAIFRISIRKIEIFNYNNSENDRQEGFRLEDDDLWFLPRELVFAFVGIYLHVSIMTPMTFYY